MQDGSISGCPELLVLGFGSDAQDFLIIGLYEAALLTGILLFSFLAKRCHNIGFHLITIDYSTLLNKLLTCRKWLLEIGINSKSPVLENLVHFLKEAMPKIGLKMESNEITQYYQMIYDCYSFIDIYEVFKNYSLDANIIGKIKRICQMKPIYKQSNTTARNYLFEFELASFFNGFDFKLSGFDDISFQIDKCNIHIECKRIASISKVYKNVRKAYNQLKSKYINDYSRGFIAISVEQITNKNGTFNDCDNLINNIGQFSSEQQMNQVVQRYSTNFNNQFRKSWNWIPDPRLIGIIQVFKFVSKLNENDNMSFIPVIVPYNDIQFENRFIIKSIMKKIAQARVS